MAVGKPVEFAVTNPCHEIRCGDYTDVMRCGDDGYIFLMIGSCVIEAGCKYSLKIFVMCPASCLSGACKGMLLSRI